MSYPGWYSTRATVTTCSSEPVVLASSIAALVASSASLEPSVASKIFVGKMLIFSSCYSNRALERGRRELVGRPLRALLHATRCARAFAEEPLLLHTKSAPCPAPSGSYPPLPGAWRGLASLARVPASIFHCGSFPLYQQPPWPAPERLQCPTDAGPRVRGRGRLDDRRWCPPRRVVRLAGRSGGRFGR